jgi:hypothetical protein
MLIPAARQSLHPMYVCMAKDLETNVFLDEVASLLTWAAAVP